MKIVFFDDQRLGGRVNNKRVYGRPKLVGQFDNNCAVPAMPHVFYNDKLGCYVLYYSRYYPVPTEKDPNMLTHCFCMATSSDAVNWQPYNNDFEFDRKYFPNQILPADDLVEVATILRDKDGVYHFYAVYVEWATLSLTTVPYASKDGVKLYEDKEHDAIQGGEPFMGSFYNRKKDCYTFITRPNWAERRCCISETKDLKTFSPLRVMLQIDSEDRPMTEVYGMPTYDMGDYYVGLVNLYDGIIIPTRQKFEKGHMNVQLAYSFDGVHFQRSLRTPFIDRGTPDSPCYGMLMPYSMIECGDNFVITASMTPYEHGVMKGKENPGNIGSFIVKKDRLIGLESDGGDAIVSTRMILWNGGELSINIQVPYGEARVRITDEDMKSLEGFDYEDCIPFTGDTLSWTPQWKNAKLDDLKGKHFIVEVKFFNGLIYAIEGNYDLVMTTMQARKTLIHGKPLPENLY